MLGRWAELGVQRTWAGDWSGYGETGLRLPFGSLYARLTADQRALDGTIGVRF